MLNLDFSSLFSTQRGQARERQGNTQAFINDTKEQSLTNVDIQISNEGKRKAEMSRMREETLQLQRDLQDTQEEIRDMLREARTRMVVIRIASRIMGGHNVPRDDQRFLRRQDKGLYIRAKSLRRLNNPEARNYRGISRRHEENERAWDIIARRAGTRGVATGSSVGAATSVSSPATTAASMLH